MNLLAKLKCKRKVLHVLEHLHSPASLGKITEFLHELGEDFPEKVVRECLLELVEAGIVRRSKSDQLVVYELVE